MPPIPFGHVMRGEGIENLKEQMDEFRTQLKEMREQLKTLRRSDAGQADDESKGDDKADDQGNADVSESRSQSDEARRPTVVDRLPTVYSEDYLAAPPYYGPYGYPQGFYLPRHNPYGFYGAPPYSSGFNVPWYSYPFNSPHVNNFFDRRLPYYYQRGGRYYYSRRPYYDRSGLKNQVAPSVSSESRSHE